MRVDLTAKLRQMHYRRLMIGGLTAGFSPLCLQIMFVLHILVPRPDAPKFLLLAPGVLAAIALCVFGYGFAGYRDVRRDQEMKRHVERVQHEPR